MRPLRASLLTVGVLALSASTAHATTFCVPAFHTACPAGGGRVAQPSLQAAVTTNGDDGTPDRVVLAAGTFSDPDTLELLSGDNDDLELVGAGAASSVVTTSAAGNIFVVNLNGARKIVMRELTVRVPGAFPDGLGAAVQAEDTTFEDVNIDVRNLGSDGVSTIGDVTWRRGRIFASAGGAVDTGLKTTNADPGLLTIEDALIEDASWGISGDSAIQELEVRRTRVEATAYGLRFSSGQVGRVENSIVVFTGDGEPVSVNADASGPTTATLRHLTITGTPPDTTEPAIVARVTDVAGAGNAQVTVSDSVVTGYGEGFARIAPSSPTKGNALITLRYSHAPLAGSGQGDGLVTLQSNINATSSNPLLDGGLRPLPGSPVIDVGDPLVAGLPTSDLDGAPRPADGDGDGNARRDMGAFEVPAPAAPPDPGTAGPAPAPSTAPPVGPPSQAAPAVPGARDTRRPAVSRLRFGRRVSARRGGTVSLTLSEPASVQVTFRPGGKRPVTLRFRGKAGVNRFRIAGRKLRARRQQVTVVATDAAGNRSAAVRARVSVRR